ncbi:MAG: class I tRNA ligase family protein [bacterium]|nr:class I tRNA ligase family protein [bacterium]
MQNYDHKKIEKKWHEIWARDKLYQADLDKAKKPFYNLMMFPYPSAEGLHVGNMYAFVHSDAYGRFMRLRGFDVFEPIGLDGFGIHSENYAIKIGEHIKDVSARTEKHFYDQLHMIGNGYDWSRTVETYKPDYYKWTQWLFLKMHEKGLAYRKKSSVNWCPSCKTVLSDEQVIASKCERCDSETEKKQMEQWFWRITDYAEKLLKNLDVMDWSEEVKTIQRNWIGKSVGAIVKFQISNYKSQINSKFKIQNSKFFLEVFTTRPDTLFGCTYMVVCPEHPLITNYELRIKNYAEVMNYAEQAKKKSDLERTDLAKEKTGVKIEGLSAVNPVNNEEIPIFVADYVLAGYGTGAIMAVPAHDERDFEFAKKYGLQIKEVAAPFLRDNPKEGKETERRDVVTVIVKNPQNNTFLCLNWNTTEWKSFPTGGIDGQDLVEAAKREVKEETGYKNLKFIKQLGDSIYAEFYRPHKDSNVMANFKYLFFELKNKEQANVLRKEKEQHEAIWIKEENVESFINVWNQKIAWKRLVYGDFAYCEEGININSGFLNGLETKEAKEKMIKWLEEKGLGRREVVYKLRDWCVSRQRYWGPPIPMVYCEKCAHSAGSGHGWHPVPEKDLPILLPEMDDFLPDGSGKGPLNKVKDFVNTTCPKCGGPAMRETDVSDPFVDSCWYYMRYLCTEFTDKALDKERLKKWMPVNMYIGGKEHSVLHLLYSRFVNMVMRELGYAPAEEPFKCFRAHGLLIRDGAKMSKSKGNVVNPDEYIEKFGADAVRMYLMFLGDMRQGGDWRDSGINGMRRFINRVWNLADEVARKTTNKPKCLKNTHKTIKKVTEDLENLKFNTAIAAIMEYVNYLQAATKKNNTVNKDVVEVLVKLLAPFAPFMSEELWRELGHKESVFKEKWPEYDPELVKDKIINLVVQVNGKLRDTIEVPADISEEEAKKAALESEKIKKWIAGKKIVKVIFVKGKLVNIAVK